MSMEKELSTASLELKVGNTRYGQLDERNIRIDEFSLQLFGDYSDKVEKTILELDKFFIEKYNGNYAGHRCFDYSLLLECGQSSLMIKGELIRYISRYT